ncbi:N-acetylglutamate synthase [Nitzschia inconspicua]|uniref:amino-acid N-acetyltransferase n=1 Tax=Nitzschia inconspicua TaxID=303405 RepID=A0A9K3L7J5_9STRA|nr:N-acetylglutamate synthase [Nitzschia inconspicua]
MSGLLRTISSTTISIAKKVGMIMLLSAVFPKTSLGPRPVAGWIQQRVPSFTYSRTAAATRATSVLQQPSSNPRTALYSTSFKYSNDHIRLSAMRGENNNNQDGKPMNQSIYAAASNNNFQNNTDTSSSSSSVTSRPETASSSSSSSAIKSTADGPLETTMVFRKMTGSNWTGDLNGELVEMEIDYQQHEMDRNGVVAGNKESPNTDNSSATTNGTNSPSDSMMELQLQEDKVSVLSIDPAVVDIYERNITNADKLDECSIFNVGDMFSNRHFVEMFRGSANYIASHRNSLVVYHIPGDLMDEHPDTFRDLMNDISLTWLMGMRIVIVAGCKYQVEKRLQRRLAHKGMVVTDTESLRVVKEEAGYVRFEVERQLARALKGSRSGGTGEGGEGNVVSGNFYSAQPFGVLDGVDYKFSGFVRKMETDKIQQVLKNRDIVLLTTLGFSPTGDVFNVNSEYLAAYAGGSLNASKLIYFLENDVAMRHKVHRTNIPHLRVNDGQKLLQLSGVRTETKGFVYLDDCPYNDAEANFLVKMGWGMHALLNGVKRVHLVSPENGALLQELYTRDGAGTMISGDLYDGILGATVRDVTAIHELITPLVEKGTLVERTKATLERDIDQYHVYTRDGLIVACGQLKMFENGYAEIGCLVVNPAYRAKGRGDAMLGYLERLCVQNGARIVFVLSTQTMEWFIERGFDEVGVDMLPPSRQATYNHVRASKIYMKKITSVRDLDASELFWDR